MLSFLKGLAGSDVFVESPDTERVNSITVNELHRWKSQCG